MPKFRNNSEFVDAIQYIWDDSQIFSEQAQDDVADFIGVNIAVCRDEIAIDTPDGEIYANKGDWITRRENGDFDVVHPDIFEKTYEAIDDR